MGKSEAALVVISGTTRCAASGEAAGASAAIARGARQSTGAAIAEASALGRPCAAPSRLIRAGAARARRRTGSAFLP